MWSISVSRNSKEMYLECICIFIYTYCLWCLLNKMMDDVCTFTFQVVTMHYPLLMGFAPELHGKNPKKILLKSHKKKWKLAFPCHPSSMCSCRIFLQEHQSILPLLAFFASADGCAQGNGTAETRSWWLGLFMPPYGGFLKWWYPTTIGFSY